MTKQSDWLQSVKQDLDESVEHLDAATQSRLTQARYQALEQKPQRLPRWVVPAGAFSSAAIAMLVLTLWNPAQVSQEVSVLDDLEIIAANVDLDFYQDLDFYEWLEQEQDAS